MARLQRGFALPTILIASVVMLFVLVASVASSSSIQTSIEDQYYNQLAREAAESGMALAESCYEKNFSSGTSALWTDAAPLAPSKNCDGTWMGGSCAANSTEDRCYVLQKGDFRTIFNVGALQIDGTIVTARVTGTVQRIRASNQGVWRTYSTTISHSITYDQFALAGGNDTTCAIVQGDLYCWGKNNMGQVGDGTTTNQPVPVKIGGALTGRTVTAVSSGIWHTCAIADNNVYCWGDNSFAQFGNGSATALSGGSHVITPLPVLAAKGINSTATSSAGIAGLSGKTLTEISARDHTCVIASGEPWCWGSNYVSQAGPDYDGTTANIPDAGAFGSDSSAIPINRAPVKVGTMTNATQIHSINASTSCVVSSSKAYCWGSGSNYIQGNGTTGGTYDTPVQVGTGVPFTSVTRMEVNNARACATNAGKVYCWGKAGIGTFGDYRIDASITAPPTTPANLSTGVLSGKTLTTVAISDWSGCVLTSAGEIYCWGYNNKGQNGNGTFTEPTPPYGDTGGTFTSTFKPRAAASATKVGGVFNDSKAIKLVSGNDYFCAMTEDGATYCWGSNSSGALGDGTTTNSATPVRTKVPAKNVIY